MDKEERAAIRRVLDGDRDAYRVLMERYFVQVHRVAWRITGDCESDAEEVAQETFLRAYNKLPGFRLDATFSTWITRIAMNTALNLVERRNRDLTQSAQRIDDDPSLQLISPGTSPEKTLLDHETTWLREIAMNALTPMERTAFVMRHMEELPIAEIAAALHVQPQHCQTSRIPRSVQIASCTQLQHRTDDMNHLSEEELVAFHLGEDVDARKIHRHLEVCEACTVLSESITHTLRVFSAEPIPHADLEYNWKRVRANLSVLSPKPRNRWKTFLLLPTLGAACAALLIMLVLGIHQHRERIRFAFNRPGPLTVEPAAELNHLDAAERLLTQVNHTEGTLDDSTVAAAQSLTLQNTLYIQQARQRGDYVEAATLENLGRVLISIDHETEDHEATLRLRMEMNTDGLLLDLRILRQNDRNY